MQNIEKITSEITAITFCQAITGLSVDRKLNLETNKASYELTIRSDIGAFTVKTNTVRITTQFIGTNRHITNVNYRKNDDLILISLQDKSDEIYFEYNLNDWFASSRY